MRQVPNQQYLRTPFINMVNKPLNRIFSVVMGAEFSAYMLLPMLTFIFFANNSPLFSTITSHDKRSVLYGLCLSLTQIGGLVANTLITALSDYYGRKLALRVSLIALIFAAGFGLSALYLHLPYLLISGFLLFSILSVDRPTGLAVVGDISTDRNRVTNMATLQCFISIGACLGPIVGGELAEKTLIFHLPYAAPFVVALLVPFGLLWLVKHTPETLNTSQRTFQFSFLQMLRDYASLLKQKNVFQLLLILMLCQLSWSTYYQFIPPLLKTSFHFSPAQVGMFIGTIAFWLILATSFGIRILSKLFSNRTLLWLSAFSVIVGISLSVVASLFTHAFWSTGLLWFAAFPTAIGDVIFYSLLMSYLSNAVTPNQQGKVMGLSFVIVTLAWSATALVGGFLLTWHTNAAIWFAPLGVLILLLIMGLFNQQILFFQNSVK